MEHSRLVDLIIRAQQGDKNALEELYVDIFNSVFRLALRMVKNPEDAEDITQEVYITVQEKISDLREPKAFYAWVNQITANKCNHILNKYKGIAKFDDEDEILALIDDDPANMPDKALDDEATRKLIMDVIDNLPDNQRTCIILFYYAQFTVVQIAEALETNENTIKTRLSVARAKIRKALEELAENKGIKLWGIPLPLTPILREAIESMPVPDGLYARIMENIHSAQQMNSSDTLGQADTTLEVESIATNYEAITPNYETYAIGKETTNMSNNYQPTNTNTVICPGCGSSLPASIAVCFRCARNLHEQTPPTQHTPSQNTPPNQYTTPSQYTQPTHATYTNPLSYTTPVAKTAATAVKSSSTGVIIAVVATVTVFVGGIVGAHFAGWVNLPFLPDITGASTQDVTMQSPQERESLENTQQEQASQPQDLEESADSGVTNNNNTNSEAIIEDTDPLARQDMTLSNAFVGFCVVWSIGDSRTPGGYFDYIHRFSLILFDNWPHSFDLTLSDITNITIYVDGIPNSVTLTELYKCNSCGETEITYHGTFDRFSQYPAKYEISLDVKGVHFDSNRNGKITVNDDKTFSVG